MGCNACVLQAGVYFAELLSCCTTVVPHARDTPGKRRIFKRQRAFTQPRLSRTVIAVMLVD